MIAYKGFAPDFTASFGSGKKQYHVGDVLEEDSSKTARSMSWTAWAGIRWALGTGTVR